MRFRCHRLQTKETVLTSYSIHYTKLYDGVQTPVAILVEQLVAQGAGVAIAGVEAFFRPGAQVIGDPLASYNFV